MTAQEYRVIADRDKGDDPVYADVDTSMDRVTVAHFGQAAEHIVRIERPVPTTCICPPIATSQEPEPDEDCPSHGRQPSPHPPTRDALGLTISAYRHGSEVAWREDLALADVLISQFTFSHPPTCEQIDAAVAAWVANRRGNDIDLHNVSDLKDRLHALIQNGADR